MMQTESGGDSTGEDGTHVRPFEAIDELTSFMLAIYAIAVLLALNVAGNHP